MSAKNKDDFIGKSQRDILIEVHTKQIMMLDTMKETFKELKDEDENLHDRITKANDRTDRKVGNVHKRVDKIRWWSIGSGGIGGFLGALFAYITGGGRQ